MSLYKEEWRDAGFQYPDFSAGLAAFKVAFPSIDADAMLEQCIAE